MLPLLLTLACSPDGEDSVDLGDPVAPLVLPDVSDVDFPAAYQEAVQLSKTVHAGRAWAGHAASLERRSSGCPDFYAGMPDVEGADGGDEGAAWADHCTTQGDVDWNGWELWDATIRAEGDPATPEGQTVDATRTLVGDGIVGARDGVGFEFSGEATDALSTVTAKDYVRWSWSSTVTGTLTGSDVFEATSDTPGGWRTDLSFYATGGDAAVYEPKGNIFLFDALLQERFDSVELDLSFLGAGAAGPDDCALEPRGWIGLRDEDAFWYDIVFLPRTDEGDDAANDPYDACDGCGTVYVRGVEAAEVGQVCLDFGFVWADAPLSPPTVEDYVLSLHALTSEAR